MAQHPKKNSSSPTAREKAYSNSPSSIKVTNPPSTSTSSSNNKSTANAPASNMKAAITQSTGAVNKAVKDIIANSSNEAKKVQEQAFALHQKNAENFADTADIATKVINNASCATTENIETLLTCSNTTLKAAETLLTECIEYMNSLFADNIDISKEFFDCKTVNDIIEWQSKIFQTNAVSYANEVAKVTDVFVEYGNNIAAPIIERTAATIDIIAAPLTSKSA